MMQRRLASIAVAAVAALAMSACGGGSPLSHDEYQQKLTTLGTQANQQAAVVLGAIFGSKGDLPKLAPQLDQAADAIDGYAGELDDLTPPDDAAEANGKLVTGFRAAAVVMHDMADAAAASDEQKVRDLSDQLSNGAFAKDLEEAGRELKAAGYTFPQGIGGTTGPTTGATTAPTSGATTGTSAATSGATTAPTSGATSGT
jgi:type VI protein secretion system component VasK